MKMISLFCGVGGLDKGFLDAGVDLEYANDADANALSTFRKNHKSVDPDRVILGDVWDVLEAKKSASADLLLGGFPCPAWSLSGHRKGFDDVRGQLFFAVLKALKQYQPAVFYFENVKGLLSHDEGRSFVRMKEEIDAAGYSVDSRLYVATDFGVPQRRERVIIAGIRKDLNTRAGLLLPEPLPHDLDLTLGEVLKQVRDRHGSPTRDHSFNHNLHDPDRKMHWIKILREGENLKDISHEEIRRREIEAGINEDPPREVPNSYQGYRRLIRNEISPTMMFGNTCLPIHPVEDRSLSVRETAAIQSFPMDFVFCGGISAQYKQVGNAVPPLLGAALAKHLHLVLNR